MTADDPSGIGGACSTAPLRLEDDALREAIEEVEDWEGLL